MLEEIRVIRVGVSSLYIANFIRKLISCFYRLYSRESASQHITAVQHHTVHALLVPPMIKVLILGVLSTFYLTVAGKDKRISAPDCSSDRGCYLPPSAVPAPPTTHPAVCLEAQTAPVLRFSCAIGCDSTS